MSFTARSKWPPETWAHCSTVRVLVVGSGPLGATFARKLVEGGCSVLMIDAGPQISKRPGEHLKNTYLYRKNALSFAKVIEESHHHLSVPVASNEAGTKDNVQQHGATSASSAPYRR